MEAQQTANGEYNYYTKYCNKTLNEWIQKAHKYNCLKNNWSYTKLKPGSFGYDNLAISIGKVLEYNLHEYTYKYISIDKIAKLIHDGWVINYIYWRDI